MSQRGEYSRALHVGWNPLRGLRAPALPAEDADRAVAQIDAEMEAIADAMYRAMGVDPSVLRHPAVSDDAWVARAHAAKTKAMQSPLWAFWESSVSPKYDDWKATQRSFQATPLTSWDTYTRWRDRVRQLHADVHDKGVPIDTPDLVDLSKPLDSTRSPLSPLSARWALIGAAVFVTVGVIAAVSSSKHEPYGGYRWG